MFLKTYNTFHMIFFNVYQVFTVSMMQFEVAKQPGANFINVLQAAFQRTDPKNAKKTVKLSVFYTILGSALPKDARRTLMKVTQRLQECANAPILCTRMCKILVQTCKKTGIRKTKNIF